MQAEVDREPDIGRKKLRDRAGVSLSMAQRFLGKKKAGKEILPNSKMFAPPPVSPDTKTARLEIENRSLRQQLNEKTEQLTRLAAASDLLKDISSAQLTPPKWLLTVSGKTHRAIATACLADTHFDEVVNPAELGGVNAYNREIAKLRLREFFKNTVKLGKDIFSGIRMEGLVMPMLGDIVSGNIHEELAESNAAAILDTCLFWSEEIAAGIEQTLKFYGQMFIPCVVGNHGRLTKKPRHKGKVRDNFDYLIYSMLARHFRNNERISFLIPDTADVNWRIYNVRYCGTHGEQFRGGSGISGALAPLMLGDARKKKRSNAINAPYDYLVFGHWHQEIDTRGLIGSNSLKGYDEYAMNNNFDYSEPSQAFWLTDPDKGRTVKAPVHVGSKDEKWEQAEGSATPLWLG